MHFPMSIRSKWEPLLPLLQVGASLRMEPEGRWWEDAFQGVISKLQPEVCCRAIGVSVHRKACLHVALKHCG